MQGKKFYQRFYRNDEGHDNEWLLPYSDMMTLILCFFLVLASVSSINLAKVATVAQAFAQSMGGKPSANTPQIALRNVHRKLEDLIALEKLGDHVRIESRPNAIAIHLQTGIFFESGSAELKPEAQRILSEIISLLRDFPDFPYQISVEGHTDSVPIHSEQFPSNWELSGARASRVIRDFLAQGFPKERIRAVGLADTQPLVPEYAPDGSPIPENQAKNRRVVIVLSYL